MYMVCSKQGREYAVPLQDSGYGGFCPYLNSYEDYFIIAFFKIVKIDRKVMKNLVIQKICR